MTDHDSLSPSEIAKQLLKQHASGSKKSKSSSASESLTFEVVSPRSRKKPSSANNYKPVNDDIEVIRSPLGKLQPLTSLVAADSSHATSKSIVQRIAERKMTLASICLIMFGVTFSAVAMFGPSTTELVQNGKVLFEHEWQPHDSLSPEGDGLGPVFNAKSCAACHFQGGIGGAGPNQHNVEAFEVEPRPLHPDSVVNGVIHAFAVNSSDQETSEYVRVLFPVVKKGERIIGVCNSVTVRDFDPLRVTSINTPALFGSGLIDGISEIEIQRNMYARSLKVIGKEFQLEFDSTPIGRVRRLPDGRIGKFGWKGQFATLEEFVSAACAVEVGLTNPGRPQEKPKHQGPDTEAGLDLNGDQFLALVTFVEELPRPEFVYPADVSHGEVLHGQQLFSSVGCADCHTPNLGSVTGLYSDLLLHRMGSRENSEYGRVERDIPIPENYPKPDEWKTPPLWGVADSAPYFHDGDSPTLHDAVMRHDGEGKHSRDKYDLLNEGDRRAVVTFLQSLKAPQIVPKNAGPIAANQP
ncbi:MAG: di-heme oxidoredictase family protein [Planctomycetaceae bacterium]